MIYIITNIRRGDNQWTYGTIDAVEKEFAKRRLDYKETPDFQSAIKKCRSKQDVILIPSQYNSLVLPIIEECNRSGVQVIVSNAYMNIGESYRFHSVQGDFYNAVSYVLSGFKSAGKLNTALYGVNTNSQGDVLFTDAFVAQNRGNPSSVFSNGGSMLDCFNSFFDVREKFDSVICVNDYVAVALIENLERLDPDYLERLYIVSVSDTLLARFYKRPITSLAVDLKTLSSAVADIYRTISRSECEYRSVNIYIDYRINERQTTHGCFSGEVNKIPVSSNVFFTPINDFDETIAYNTDPEVALLPKIEIFLNNLSKIELSVLKSIISGSNVKQLGEEFYLSEEAVRYHLKKMRVALGCGTTNEMREKLSGLLNPVHIAEYLKQLK